MTHQIASLCNETFNYHWICGISPGIALRPLGVFEPLFLFIHFFGILRRRHGVELIADGEVGVTYSYAYDSHPSFIRTRLFHFELLNSERTTLLPDDCSTDFQGLSSSFFLDVTKLLFSFLYCLAQSCQAETENYIFVIKPERTNEEERIALDRELQAVQEVRGHKRTFWNRPTSSLKTKGISSVSAPGDRSWSRGQHRHALPLVEHKGRAHVRRML